MKQTITTKEQEEEVKEIVTRHGFEYPFYPHSGRHYPKLTIEDGYWCIDGEKTTVKAYKS